MRVRLLAREALSLRPAAGLALLEGARSVGDRQRVYRLSSWRVHDRTHVGGGIFFFFSRFVW